MPESPSQILLEWQALNAHPYERGSRWYLIGAVCILLFAVYGILEGSWTTPIVALLIGGIYFMIRNEKPRTITIRITGIGMQVEEMLTPWSQLKDFWILMSPDFTELHISPQRSLQREIVVFIRDPQTPLANAPDPGMVRAALLNFLPERVGMEERMLDTIARLLKL